MRYYPSIDEILSNKAEVLLELKRTPRSMFSLVFWAIIWFLIVSIFWFLYPSGGFPIPYFTVIPFPVFYIIPLAFVIETARQYHDDLYIFEHDKITHRDGRFSLKYSIPAIHYRDVRAVSISQTFTARLFDFGTIILNTAAQDEGEVVITAVRAPEELAEIVEVLRRREMEESGGYADSRD